MAANRDDPAAMNLYRVDVHTGAMTALGQALDYHRKSVVSHSGQWLAANAGHWGQPPELKLIQGLTSSAAPAQVLTQSHDPALRQLLLQTPERFAFKNRHGDELQAYVFKPAGWRASDQRPAVVYVYGSVLGDGHMVERDSFQDTAYWFQMYMALKHGYVTVTLDTRGHSNYGQAFSRANWEQPGRPQTEDLQDAVAYISQNLGVDRQRMGLTGWSFGGFQTQYTLYTQPDLFLDPDGGHGLGGAVKNAGWHRKYEAFWLRHLGRAP
ncbi:alpha/beta hydrolase family protein [Roseateles sp. BYS180W]|uniref:Alpha/beta hydrolase family protein n=1 Tax=Roseateles rivi TaxID=3299028 RepID=A0ABW7FSJ6_9BURK